MSPVENERPKKPTKRSSSGPTTKLPEKVNYSENNTKSPPRDIASLSTNVNTSQEVNQLEVIDGEVTKLARKQLQMSLPLSRDIVCHICSHVFSNFMKEYRTHFLSAHDINATSIRFQCRICNFESTKQSELEDHWLKHHKQVDVKFINKAIAMKVPTAPVNPEEIIDSSPMESEQIDKTAYFCSDPVGIIRIPAVEDAHITAIDGTTTVTVMHPEAHVLKCGVCNDFRSTNCAGPSHARKGLRGHLAKVHDIPQFIEQLRCRVCGINHPINVKHPKTYAEKHWRDLHSFTHIIHLESLGNYQCRVCSAAFDSEKSLVPHVKHCETLTIEQLELVKSEAIEKQRLADEWIWRMPSATKGFVSLSPEIVYQFLKYNGKTTTCSVYSVNLDNNQASSVKKRIERTTKTELLLQMHKDNLNIIVLLNVAEKTFTCYDFHNYTIDFHDIKNTLLEMGYKKSKPTITFPKIKEGELSGAHACLLGRWLMRGKSEPMYTPNQVAAFLELIKRAELIEEKSDEPPRKKQKCESSKTADPEQQATPECVLEQPTSEPRKMYPLMDLIVPPPQHLKYKTSNVVAAVSHKLPDQEVSILVNKLLIWCTEQIEMYIGNGKTFTRLNWLVETFTMAANSLARLDESMLDEVLQRNHPLDVLEGEISTQTSPPRKLRLPKKTAPLNINKAYEENRSRTYNKLMGAEDKMCQIPLATLESYFQNISKKSECNQKCLDNIGSDLPKAVFNAPIDNSFHGDEVLKVLKEASDSAPGPDGLRYTDLKQADPSCIFLTFIFNECRTHMKIPPQWKESDVKLLYKTGDELDPANWRPISLQATIYKIYSSLWNSRIKAVKNLFSPEQKGFTSVNGCGEHICRLRCLIDNATINKEDLAITWLDLENAFGSIPHNLIFHALTVFGFPNNLVNIVKDIYSGSSIQIATSQGFTDPVIILSGVKQGDPLSPTLFNIALEFLIRPCIKRFRGHQALGRRHNLIAFADDLALIGNNTLDLQVELNALNKEALALNLKFKAKKCCSLVLRHGECHSRETVTLKTETVRTLETGETFKYLGIPLGANNRISLDPLLSEAWVAVEKLTKSALDPHQKIDALKTFVMPKLVYLLSYATPKMTDLRSLDDHITRSVKEWLRIPQWGPREYIQLPVSKGGLGIISVVNLAHCCLITSILCRLWGKNRHNEHHMWESIKQQAAKHASKSTVDSKEAVEFLNLKLINRKQSVTLVNRIQHALAGLTKDEDQLIHSITIKIDDNSMISLEIRSTEAIKPVVVTQKDQKDTLKIMKRCIGEGMSYSFDKKGSALARMLQCVRRDKVNNNFVSQNGGYLSVAAHNFIHHARNGPWSLNDNPRAYATKKDLMCRYCKTEKESLSHVLNCCQFQLATAITDRHNLVLAMLVEATREGAKGHYTITVDKALGIKDNSQRPDLVLENKEFKQIVIVDVTCPYEHSEQFMKDAHDRKITKYTGLLNTYKRKGYKGGIYPVVIGSLGTWRPENAKALVELGIPAAVNKKMIPKMTAMVIESSKDIYWRHVKGNDLVVHTRAKLAQTRYEGFARKYPVYMGKPCNPEPFEEEVPL